MSPTRQRYLIVGLFLWSLALSAFVVSRDHVDVYDVHPQTGIVWSLGSDPTVPPGLSAPAWQFLIRTDNPSLYFKSGLGNTDWTLLGNGSATAGLTAVFRDAPLAGSGTNASHLRWAPTLGGNLQGTGSAGSALDTVANPAFTSMSLGTGPGVFTESPGFAFVSEGFQATGDIISSQDITAHGNVEANQTLEADVNAIIGTTITYNNATTPVDVKASNGDPSGSLSAHQGSLDVDFANSRLYQNTTGGTVWTQVGAPTQVPFFDTTLTSTLSGPGAGIIQVDNWNPGALGTNTLIQLTISNLGFAINISGLVGGAAGKTVTVCNINSTATSSSARWSALDENTSSSAGNRFLFRGGNDEGGGWQVCFSSFYDATVSRWRGYSVN